ncbi:cyclophilin-like domain-containing protein [Scheffersomyces xylosifermentans]|uniref:cyclophilin-like domain-containing protein n=1 Tax=Scheffersomyces xylosifermentans TaxID=1304137 RepID=UPI00315CD9FA
MKVTAVRPFAFLDISIGGKEIGRIVVELYDDLAPKSSKNFINLCKGVEAKNQETQGVETLGYKNTVFHRVLKNFVIQGGDLKYGKVDASSNYPHEKLGQGNISTIDPPALIEGENLTEPLDGPFKLCMANNGNKDANGSQFFITTYPQPHLTGHHTVFGRVVHGKSVVREVERVRTNKENIPNKDEVVLIHNCGEWDESMSVPVFNASYDTRGGDIYEEYPDDDEHIDKESSESVYIASTKIKESGTLLFKAGEKQQAFLKYRKCMRYIMEYIPDEDQEPEWYAKYIDLKKKVYLNLSLVCLQLKNYTKAVDYSSYLLEMGNLSNQDKAKAHFRKGSSLIELKKYKLALADLNAAHSIVPDDVAINRELTRCEGLLEVQKQAEKAKYAKFFK